MGNMGNSFMTFPISFVYVNSGGVDLGSGFGDGNLRSNIVSGLTSGQTILAVAISIFSNFGGNMRIKIYDSAAGLPTTLLGESGSTAMTGNGFNECTMIAPVVIPAAGIIHLALELDSNLPHPEGEAGTTDTYRVAHTYGAGPDPFGVSGGASNRFYWRIKEVP